MVRQRNQQSAQRAMDLERDRQVFENKLQLQLSEDRPMFEDLKDEAVRKANQVRAVRDMEEEKAR